MKCREINALCLTETKKKGSGMEELSEGSLLCWSGVDFTERGKEGTAILLSPDAKESVRSFNAISSRIISVDLKISILRVKLICAYAPCDSENDLVKKEFWDRLNDIVSNHDPGVRLVLGGDFNGWVGVAGANEVGNVLGPFNHSYRKNANGDELIKLCTENDLFISNTWYPHDVMYTWERGGHRTMIDYLILDERLRELLDDTKVLEDADCGTDHFLVISHIRLGQGWVNRPKLTKPTRIKVETLQDSDIRIAYAEQLGPLLREEETDWGRKLEVSIEDAWTHLRDSVVDSAESICGVTVLGRMRGDAWWNREVKEAVEKKKDAYRAVLAARGTLNENLRRDEYKIRKRECKEIVKRSKTNSLNEEERRMQEDFEGNKKLFWKWVKRARNSDNGKLSAIKDGDGDLVWETSQVAGRWKEYFEGIYGEVAVQPTAINNVIFSIQNPVIKDVFSAAEVSKAISILKNGKSAGVDRISGEMIKYGPQEICDRLVKLFNTCFGRGEVPSDFKKAVIVPVYKGKGSKSECQNYRGISLLSVVGKLYGRLLINRVIDITKDQLWDVQSGFMPGRSCADQIFSLQQIVEKALAVNKKVYCAFVDFEKAYDSIDRDILWQILLDYGVPLELVTAIRSFYVGSEACVRTNGVFSILFRIYLGVRQGCPMSAWLFNIFIDKCNKDAFRDKAGFKIGREVIRTLVYADDEFISAESPEDLQCLLDSLHGVSANMGLKVNVKKTKICVFSRSGIMNESTFYLGGEAIEEVSEFVYLGRLFENNGSVTKEIDRRVGAGRRVIGGVNAIVRSQRVTKQAKIAIYKGVVVPTVLYGCESWALPDRLRSKVNAVGMDYLRSVCGIRRVDCIRNERVLEECGVEDAITKILDKSSLRWFGHITRMPENRITKEIYVGAVEGSRPIGRPAKTWEDSIREIFERYKVPSRRNRRTCVNRVMGIDEAREICLDRKEWKALCSF